jgi:hypothetical protein
MKNAAREERDVSMGLAGGGEVETSPIGPIIIGTEMTSEERKGRRNGLVVKIMAMMGTMCRRRVGVVREGEITSLAAAGGGSWLLFGYSIMSILPKHIIE